ncbi:hypothetical protein HRI_000372000 [Hibiscus trionum]|uniref:Uncharacterized protein n=1 Tax=Hibiscus trionum TaxID=183268 RepID=A0A9W7GWU1_HIBTR|nr:hypothetical protein HRI_000372000 [Hibiscus trionum]
MILILSSSQGFSRILMENAEPEESTAQSEQEFADRYRETIGIMDYKEPGPNTNPRTGYIFCPPPQPY